MFLRALILLCAVVLAYLPSMGSGFMEDDFLALKGDVRNWDQVVAASFAKTDITFRPLLKLLVGVEYHFFGYNADLYRWVGLVLFALSCIAVMAFMRPVFGNLETAFYVALCYALHPINQTAVLAFSSSYLSLLVMLSLGAIHWAVRPSRRKRDLLLSVVCFIAALMCHESAMLVPVYIFLYAFILQRKQRRAALVLAAPSIALLAGYLTFRLSATAVTGHLMGNVGQGHLDPWIFAATFFKLVHWYLMNLLKPDGIVVIWSSRLCRADVLDWLTIGVMWALVVWWLCRCFAPLRVLVLGTCWLVVGFLPALAACVHYTADNLIIEPYWFIIASLGFMMIVAALWEELFRNKRWQATVLAAVTCLGWLGADGVYASLWANDRVYGMYYLSHAGDYVPANTYMANIFLRHREEHLAGAYILQSHQDHLATDWPRYFADLGFVDFQAKRYAQARENYRKALAFAPRYYPCYVYLGIIAFIEGDLEEAQRNFQVVIAQDASELLSRLNMAAIYKKRQQVDKAAGMLKDVLRIDPHNEPAQWELLKIYLERNDRREAMAMAGNIRRESRNPAMLRLVEEVVSRLGQK